MGEDEASTEQPRYMFDDLRQSITVRTKVLTFCASYSTYENSRERIIGKYGSIAEALETLCGYFNSALMTVEAFVIYFLPHIVLRSGWLKRWEIVAHD